MGRHVLIDMTGIRYGRLLGIAYSHRESSGHAHWLFLCDCGTSVTVDGARVRAGNTTSCGCRHRELSAALLLVHGHRAAKRHDDTFRAWQSMKDGCYNPASPRYGSAGACGIEVCPDWLHNYERFFAGMGRRAPGTTLERVDAAGDHARHNCAWRLTETRATRAAKGWARRRGQPRSDRLAPTNLTPGPESWPTPERGRRPRWERQSSAPSSRALSHTFRCM